MRCGRALVGACSALLGMGRGEITCARKLSPNVIAYVCYARGSERTSEFRPVWHPRNPASGSRRRTAGGSASYARRHAARRPEREDDPTDPDADPRSDDEIFVVPRKIRYALRARRRNVARRAFRSLLYLIIPVRRAFIAFAYRSREIRDPCTCTVERSTPTTT